MRPATMRWLMLSLAVLLAHLGLLQALPGASLWQAESAPAGLSAQTLAPSFVTRAIAVAPTAGPAAQSVPAAPAAPTKPAPRPTRAAAPALAATPSALTAPAVATAAPPAADASAPEAALPALAPDLSAAADPAEQPGASGQSSADQHPTALMDAAAPPAESQASVLTLGASSTPPPGPDTAPLPEPPLRFDSTRLSPSTRLTYVLSTTKFPISLRAELLWQRQGQSYQARLSYSAFGLSRSQTSRGQITDRGLAPERFADKYRSELAAHFNYLEGKVSFSANTPDAVLLSGAQDRLSVLLQLGALVASDPGHFTPGRTLTLQTVGPRSADLWLFSVIQTELLSLPGGQVNSLKLQRQPRGPYDQRVEVWLAPDLAYLPARIRITEANGDSVDQQWSASAPAEPER